jgi:cytochrome c2
MTRHRLIAVAAVVALTAAATPALCEETSPIAAGKGVFEKKCVSCHSLERSLALQADRAGWETILKRMITKGAKIDKAEYDQVLGYLGAKSAFESRCNSCHDLQRPLKSIKSPEQWQATVARMAAMKPGVITEAEAGAISLYLSLVTPAAK